MPKHEGIEMPERTRGDRSRENTAAIDEAVVGEPDAHPADGVVGDSKRAGTLTRFFGSHLQ